jgi:hypothetical protein
MSELKETLEALVEEWRRKARRACERAVAPPFNGRHRSEKAWKQNGIRAAYEQCADALEKILEES